MITSRAELLQSLKRQLRQISGAELPASEEVEVMSTGLAAMDELLPLGGVPRGGLVEWLTAGGGAGGAEVGRGQGVLFRSDRALRQASWADVRWLVEPPLVVPPSGGPLNTRRLRLELAYCRGVLGGARVEVECDHETGLVRVVPQLADS